MKTSLLSFAMFVLTTFGLAAQTQASTVVSAPANVGNQLPNAATVKTNPADGEATIEVTKVEEQVTGGGWVDVTNAVTRNNNPSKEVTIEFGQSVASKTFRITYKSTTTLQGRPTTDFENHPPVPQSL